MVDALNVALEGRYVIARELGQGGMATVYLAEDVRHKRQVAVKVLRPELAAVVGAERFLSEIETTANLQHPHILPLFDSGQADGFLFYVMPYVEGESLRERLQTEHQLPVDEALDIAENVGSALQYAHEQGVVHRDIKPANILLSRGEPLVADFGIALALTEAGDGRITETGLSLGTPHYMSPEQASGERTLDPRSDVYALGGVLYEMLTGRPPYSGPTAQAVLGQILTGEPAPLTKHRKAIPIHVEHAVLKALEKLPADRFETAEAFVRALKNQAFRHVVGRGKAVVDGARAARRWRLVAALALVGVVVLAARELLGLAGGSRDSRVHRQRVVLGSGTHDLSRMVSQGMALAPDGSGILFADTAGRAGGTTFAYWWKPRGQTDPVLIANMDDALVPTFSPDGEWVAFIADGQLRKQPLRGGTAVALLDSVTFGSTGALAWLESGELLLEAPQRVLTRVSADGTERDTIPTGGRWGAIHAAGLRGGGGALLTACIESNCANTELVLFDLERDTAQVLAQNVLRAWHTAGNQVVYVNQQGAVFAATLDRDEMRLEPPIPLFDGVATSSTAAEMQLGSDGSLVYVRGNVARALSQVVWVDRQGRTSPVDPDWGADEFRRLSLAPDDDRLAVSIVTAGVDQVWVKELPAGPLTRLTVGTTRARRPVWTRDGRRVAYITLASAGGWHARSLRADGSSPAPDTLAATDRSIYGVLPPDDAGRIIVRVGDSNQSAADVGLIESPDTTVTWILSSPFNEMAVARSHDGRWLAYVSDFSGRREVYVRPFPDVDARRIQVSTAGGTEPVWGHGGRELFFRDGEGWMTAARFTTEPEFRVVGRGRLFDARPFLSDQAYRVYDLAQDDQRFVMLQQGDVEGEPSTANVILVENWLTELAQATGGG